MAAATPDLLLAMAISSQVSSFVSWGFGDTGHGLHAVGGGGALTRSSSYVHTLVARPTGAAFQIPLPLRPGSGCSQVPIN